MKNKENSVYYRILMVDNDVFFPCMQDFDEVDYNQSNFLSEERFTDRFKAVDAFLLMQSKARLLVHYNLGETK